MLIAYDLETTKIQSGTPRLLYVTAYGEHFKLSMPITGDNRLQTFNTILETHFLIPEHNKAKFVAWNGNNYDAYFIAQALLLSDDWTIQPYMTASKALRGMKVKSKYKVKIDGKLRVLQFQFLDGISMTGLQGRSLSAFLKTFAPELPKLSIGDLETVDFNPNNPDHVKYAERDSEGLYIGMRRVEQIINDLTCERDEKGDIIKPGLPLKPTIGNIAVNYFMQRVPPNVELKRPYGELKTLLHGDVKRGGYCWCQRPYTGPVWKYDINQAYAAAMRDCALPAGTAAKTAKYIEGQPGIYSVRLSRKIPAKVPFYYKTKHEGRFTDGTDPVGCWLTSIEIDHLKKDGWKVETGSGWLWESSFNFAAVVDDLERLRSTDSEGPSGPLGTMVKAIGNNAYGKTLERLNGEELVLAKECPEGFNLYDPFNDEHAGIFCRSRPAFDKPYHLPQVGVFVTAHVRCLIRSTALLAPDHFLYADTDCAVFSCPVDLPIHKTHYGDWKIEAENEFYIIVGKKIYFGADGATKAKGLQTRKLSRSDYEKWLLEQPEQEQIQRQNFLKFLQGDGMFKRQSRKGTDVTKSKVYKLKDGRFIPTG